MLSILELDVVQKCNPALYFGSRGMYYDPYLPSFRFGCMLRAGARFRFIVLHTVLIVTEVSIKERGTWNEERRLGWIFTLRERKCSPFLSGTTFPDYESVLSISTKCSSYLRIIYLDIAADDSIVVVSVINLLFLALSGLMYFARFVLFR